MNLKFWLKRIFGIPVTQTPIQTRTHRRKSSRLTVEQLEVREVPTTYFSTASGNWNSAATWNNVGVPGAGDIAIIQGGFTVTVNVANAAATTVQVGDTGSGTLLFNSGETLSVANATLGFSGNTGTLNMTSGGTLNVSGAFNITADGTFNAGTSASNGTINYDGSLAQTVTATTYDNLKVSGSYGTNDVTLDPSANINVMGTFANDATFGGGSYIVTSSTVVFDGTAAQTITGPPFLPTLNNLTIDNTSGVTLSISSSTLTVTNSTVLEAGTLTLSGSSNLTTGTMTSTGGSLTDGGSTDITITGDSGTVWSLGAGTYTDNGTVTFTGNNPTISGSNFATLDVNVGAGDTATLNIANSNISIGSLDVQSGTLQVTGGDDLSVTGSSTISSTLILNGTGTYALASTVTVSGTLDLEGTAGSYSIGSLSITGTGTFDNSSDVNVSMTGASISNAGTFTTGSETYTFSNATAQLSGANGFTFANVSVSASDVLTNATNVIITDVLGGTGTFTNGTGSTVVSLTLGATPTIGTLTANTDANNTVIYTDGDIFATAYYNLQVDTLATVDLTGTTTVATALTVTAGALSISAGADSSALGAVTIDASGSVTLTGATSVSVVSLANSGALTDAVGSTITVTGTGAGTWTNTSNNYTANGTIIFDGAAPQIGASNFSSLTIDGASTAAVLEGNVTISSNLTITSVSLTTGTFNLSVSGSGGDVTSIGSGGTLNLGSGVYSFYNVTISPGGTYDNTGNGNVTLTGSLSDSNGNFTAGTGTYFLTGNGSGQTITTTGGTSIQLATVSVGGTYTNSGLGTLTVTNSLTGAGTFTNGNGTNGELILGNGTGAVTVSSSLLSASPAGNIVEYNPGGSTSQTVAATTYYNLVLESGADAISSGMLVNNNMTVGDPATISNSGAFTVTSQFTYNSTQSSTLGANMTVGKFLQTAGTFSEGGSTINVTGTGANTWDVSGGTFNPATGTTIFMTGVSPSIDAASFYNLTISTPGTASLNGTVAVGGALSISSGSNLQTNANALSVTGTTTINGILTLSGAASTYDLGAISVTSTGTFNDSSNSNVAVAGSVSLSNGGVFTAGTGTYTLSNGAITTGSTSTLTLANATVSSSSSYANDGTLTITSALAGGGTFTNAANATLNLTASGSPVSITTLTATAAGNTVNYSGAAQTVFPANGGIGGYANLTLSGSGTKSMTGITSVTGNLNIQGTAVMTNDSGSLVVGGALNYSSTAASPGTVLANAISIGSFDQTAGFFGDGGKNITVTGTGTVWSQAGGTFTTTGTTTFTDTAGTPIQIGTTSNPSKFSNLVITLPSNSDTATLGSNVTTGTFSQTVGTFSDGGFTMTLTGNSGTVWSQSTGTNFTATAGGIETFTGTAPQIGSGTTSSFSNLTINLPANSNTATLGGAAIIGGALTITKGTLKDAGNTITVGGNWTNNGVFLTTGTTIFDGTATIIGSTAFNILTIDLASSSDVADLSGAVSVAGSLTVTQGTLATLGNNLSVTGATNLSGTLALGGASATDSFTGDITVASTGSFSDASTTGTSVTIAGNIINNGGNFSGGPSDAYDLTGTTKSISGTVSIPNLAIGGSYTNSGTLTVGTLLSGAGTLTNAAAGVLKLGGGATITTLTTSAAGNTVIYDGSTAQSVLATTYSILQISDTGATATMAGGITVTGSLAITSGTLATGANTLTALSSPVSISGTLTLGANASMGAVTINGGGTLIDNGFTITTNGAGAGAWSNSGTYTATGTVDFTGTAPQIGASNFKNLTIAIPSANTATLAGTSTVTGTLTVATGTLALAASSTFSLGSVVIDSSAFFNDGGNTITVAGNWTNGGTFNSTGTTTFTGLAPQIGASSFNNLTIDLPSNSDTATLTGAITVGSSSSNSLTITQGKLATAGNNLSVTGTTSITGGLNLSGSSATDTFTGNVTVAATGSFSDTSTTGTSVSISGSITNNGGTFSGGPSDAYNLTGTSQTISGTVSIPNLAIGGSYTNSGTLSVGTLLSGSGSLTNPASGTLKLGGGATITTLTTSAAGNTVIYDGSTAQSVLATTYSILQINDGTSTATMAGPTAVTGTLTITSGTLSTGANILTALSTPVIITGTLDLGANASMGAVTINSLGTLIDNGFTITTNGTGAGAWTNSGSYLATGTVKFTGSAPQIGASGFKNLTINIPSANTATLAGASTISGTLSILTGTLDLAGTAAFSFGAVAISSGATFNDEGNNITVAGNWTNAGTYTTTGTTTFTGTAPQIGATVFNNLTIDLPLNDTATLSGAVTVGTSPTNSLTITQGTLATAGNSLNVTGPTSIAGTLSLSGSSATDTFSGNITVASTGTFIDSSATGATVSIAGSIINNGGTFSGGPSDTYDLTGTNQTLNGAVSIPNLVITTNGIYTNSGTLTVGTLLSGAGVLTNAATGTLNIGGAITIATLITSAAGNTVDYDGSGAQTVYPDTYAILIISGAHTSNNVTLAASGTVTSTNFMANATFTTGGYVISGGSFTLPTNVTVGNFTETAGNFDSVGLLTVTGVLTWTGGTMTGNAVILEQNFTNTATVVLNSSQSYTAQVQGFNILASVQAQYDLQEQANTTNYNFNQRGADEIYLISDSGANSANGNLFFVLPNGNLYAWDGNSITTSEQNPADFIANIGTAAYSFPGLLNNPPAPYNPTIYSLEQTLDLTGPTVTNQQDEYFVSQNGSNSANAGGYILLANGNLYTWLGSYSNSTTGQTPVATLSSAYFATPSLLTDPTPPGTLALVDASFTSNTLSVTDSISAGQSFVGSADIAVTSSPGGQTYNFQVTFTDVAPVFVTVPGNQTVNFPTSNSTGPLAVSATDAAGNGVTYSATVGAYNALSAIEEQFGLEEPPGTTNYYYNARNIQEKYLISTNGSNAVDGGYYILVPNGNLYTWTNNSLSQTLAAGAVATPGTAVYSDPTLLTGALPSYNPFAYSVEQSYDLKAPTNSSNYNFNMNGAQEKYLVSSNGSNSAGGGLYVLLPDGYLFAWDGRGIVTTLETVPVATLSTIYYQNPQLLIDDVPPGAVSGVTATTAGTNVTVNDSGFVGTVVVYVTASDGYLTSTQSFQVTFNDLTAPTVGIAAANGTGINTATTSVAFNVAATATLTPSSGIDTYDAPEIGGYSNLAAVEQTYALVEPAGTSNFFFNARSAQEKYLVSTNGNNSLESGFYILLPNGNLYAWDGNSVATSESSGFTASLGTVAYLDPSELIDSDIAYNPYTYSAEQSFDLQAPANVNGKSVNSYFNARGDQEKYFVSKNGSNAAGGGYYVLMPNGNLYAWTGNDITITLASTPVATLPVIDYNNPGYLTSAASPGPLTLVNTAGLTTMTTDVTASIDSNTNTLTVTDTGGFVGTVIVYVTVTDGVLTSSQTPFQVTFTDVNPPTLTISATDGSGVDTSSTTLSNNTAATATLTPSSNTTFQTPQVAGYSQLSVLEQQLSLATTPDNDFYNARNGSEKYLVSTNGSNPAGGGYYVLFSNGNMFAYSPDFHNDLVNTESGTAITVGTSVYNDPTLLTNATPPYNPTAYSLASLDLQTTPSNNYFNSRGDSEEYLRSGNGSNPAGGGYYVLFPTGALYAWAGSMPATLASNPVATLPTVYYTNPSFLISAAGPGLTSGITATITGGNTLTVNDTNDFLGTIQVFVTITDGALTTTQAFTVTFT